MIRKVLITVLCLLLAGALIPWFWIEFSEKPFDEAARVEAPGQFVQLTNGKLHYNVYEPNHENNNGKTIVLLHGLYVPNFMFSENTKSLVAAGYRVFTPDMFGHGYSDRPTKKYNSDFFDRMVLEFLEAVSIQEPVIIGGQSTGGAVATLFAARHPERIEALVLLVPAGIRLHGTDDDFASDLLRTPVIGDWFWRVVVRTQLLAPWPGPCDVCGTGKLAGDAHVQTRYKGYFSAMLNILRNFPLRKQERVFANAGKGGFPVLAIFGGKDETVHIKSADILQKSIPNAKVVIMENGDHAVNFRKPDETNEILLAFLKEL